MPVHDWTWVDAVWPTLLTISLHQNGQRESRKHDRRKAEIDAQDEKEVAARTEWVEARPPRHDHKFTLASLALVAPLLVAGLAAWVVKNPGTAAVDPRPEYADRPS